MENTMMKSNPMSTLELLRKIPRITMPDKPRTTIVPPEDVADTVRKLEEYTDYPIETTDGRKLIRRVEKIRMPNGRYRYPETILDITPGGHWETKEEREARRGGRPIIKSVLSTIAAIHSSWSELFQERLATIRSKHLYIALSRRSQGIAM